MSFSTGGERLDDNLFRIGQPIHHQAEAAAIGVQHGDEVVALGGRLVRAAGHQQPVKKNQRQQLAAQPVERRILNPLDGRKRPARAEYAPARRARPGAAQSSGRGCAQSARE